MERGIKIYHLNIGQPDIPTPEDFLEQARLDPGQVLAYSPSAGLYAYRQALARYYNGFDLAVPITDQDILVTTGGKTRVSRAPGVAPASGGGTQPVGTPVPPAPKG